MPESVSTELADLVGVRRPAALDDEQQPVAFAVALGVAQQQPGVDERGDRRRAGLGLALVVQAGEHGRDAAGLEHVQLAGDGRGRPRRPRRRGSGWRPRRAPTSVGSHVVQEPVDRGPGAPPGRRPSAAIAPDLQQPRVDPALEVDADRAHVAHDLVGATPRRRRTAPAPRGRRRHRPTCAAMRRLAGAGRAADQHRGAAVDAARRASRRARAMPVRHPLLGGARSRAPTEVMRPTTSPRSRDQERVLVRAVQEPRYFTMRRRRVAISSSTRWSSTITQSETYSSMPKRVSVPLAAALAGDHRRQPRSLSQRNSRPSSARTMASLASAANSTSMVSSTTRLAPTASTAAAEPDEQALEVEVAGLDDLGGVDVDGVDDEPAVGSSRSRSKPSEATLAARSGASLLEGQQHAGLAELAERRGPGTRGRTASCPSPHPRRPASGARRAARPR